MQGCSPRDVENSLTEVKIIPVAIPIGDQAIVPRDNDIYLVSRAVIGQSSALQS